MELDVSECVGFVEIINFGRVELDEDDEKGAGDEIDR